MGFFDWKNEYSVGIDAINKQHKVIIELMNDLFESIRDSREDMIIKEVLEEMLKYSNYHFGLEKSLFEKYNYSKSEEHLREHDYFIGKIELLMKELKSNIQSVPIETLDYLKNWFQNHMMKKDIDYSKYFQEKDVINEIEKLQALKN